MAAASAPVVLGRIIGTYGVRGWVRIYSDCRPPENIFKYKKLIASSGEHSRELELTASRIQPNGLVAKFHGIDDMDQALLLKGYSLAVSQLPPRRRGEYYWRDLIDLQVRNTEGESLGKVENLMETGANDVLIVNGDHGEILIPYVISQFIDTIDLEQGLMVVNYPLDWLHED